MHVTQSITRADAARTLVAVATEIERQWGVDPGREPVLTADDRGVHYAVSWPHGPRSWPCAVTGLGAPTELVLPAYVFAEPSTDWTLALTPTVRAVLDRHDQLHYTHVGGDPVAHRGADVTPALPITGDGHGAHVTLADARAYLAALPADRAEQLGGPAAVAAVIGLRDQLVNLAQEGDGWPGGDVVDLVERWFTQLGLDFETATPPTRPLTRLTSAGAR